MNPGEQTSITRPVECLIAELKRGIEIIRELDYDHSSGGMSSIGAHIRHNLDFVNALLNGIAERRVDYDARPRDRRVENDRDYAVEQLRFSISRLTNLTPAILNSLVVVRSEIDGDLWHTSSVSREVEFLHSHTVHHYALIARLLIASGRTVSDDLGVAPSTLRFNATSASKVYAGNY